MAVRADPPALVLRLIVHRHHPLVGHREPRRGLDWAERWSSGLVGHLASEILAVLVAALHELQRQEAEL